MKELEITHHGGYRISDELTKQGSPQNEIFMVNVYTTLECYAFQSIIRILSTCHQLEYFRYGNTHSYEWSSSPSSLSIISAMNNNPNSFCLSLRYLEIQIGETHESYMEHILKQCPNLRILRLRYAWLIEPSVLDSIRRYCPHLKYLCFDCRQNILRGKDLYYQYYPESSTLRSSSNNAAATKLPSPLLAPQLSTPPALKTLYLRISNTDPVVPFLNQYSDTIEDTILSFPPGANLSSMQIMNRLTSLVMTYAGDPRLFAVVISNAPSLRNVELRQSYISVEVSNALKKLNTLEKLKFNDEVIDQDGLDDRDDLFYEYAGRAADNMVDVFNTYAEASMFAATATSSKEREKNAGDRGLSQRQPHGRGWLTHVTLLGCDFTQDPVLEALGNIKTLSHVYVGSAPLVTTKGINAFCEQLNLLPELGSIELYNVPRVEDSTLSILGLSSTARTSSNNITRNITLNSLRNVTEEGLDQLSKKQGVSIIAYNTPCTDRYYYY